MRLRSIFLSIALLYIIFLAAPAQAQVKPGVRAGAYFDSEAFFIGGEILTPVAESWYFNPNVEFAFGDNADLVTFNFDFHYDFDTHSNYYIWIGGGPAIIHVDPDGRGPSDTDFGANIFMGVGFQTRGRLVPYIQPKIILADNSEFALAFGLRF
ncbi:MAG TPA: hypothetical protein VLH08_16465 [Acidobacteriota bacterium]|nr:hypothetical protein [Acidobacteriota bacterium]